jgi:hypothetical protein
MRERVRLSELIAACERLEVSMRPEAIADWQRRPVPLLGGETPLATLASGAFEQIVGIAEDLIYPTFTPDEMGEELIRVPPTATGCPHIYRLDERFIVLEPGVDPPPGTCLADAPVH